MNFDDFVGQVQHRARLADTGEAMRAIRATLETLAERLAGGEAKDLAAQLPREIGVYLLGEYAPVSERFSLDEFFHRVKDREGPAVDLPAAVFHARVVMEVLSEAVSRGELEDVRAQLPPEFESLFVSGSSGPLRRS